MQVTSFDKQLQDKCQMVNRVLKGILVEQSGIDAELRKAMEYTLAGNGKRVRPALVLWCCELVCGGVNHNAEIAAAAIEMVHTYSLIHDDLPAMDDDDFRRGKPSCHKAFNEATAILAGDALLTLAFGILCKEVAQPAIAVRLIDELAVAAGPAGMLAGQMADLRAERVEGGGELLEDIHINKTAKMFRCAAAMGAICGGATGKQYDCLCEYGLKVGLGFQIADDILDVAGTTEQLGKTAGKDARADKCTYPKIVGMEESKGLAARLANEAVEILEHFGEKAEALRQLVKALLQRTR